MEDTTSGCDGRMFIELFTPDVPAMARLFTEVFGFHEVRNEPGFVTVSSKSAVVLLNDGRGLPAGHRFEGRVTGREHGNCVEIGIAVENIDETHARAAAFGSGEVSGVVLQEWGVRDFRIVTAEGFYLRVTEPTGAIRQIARGSEAIGRGEADGNK